MQFQYDQSLDGVLESIEAALVERVPAKVKSLAVTEPCYALFLWYFDSSTDEYSPLVGLGTHAVRDACGRQYAGDESERIDCLWRPQQTLENHRLIPQHHLNDESLREQCNRAYELMLAANTSDLPLPDEGEILLPFRSMLWRVARRLNDIDWREILNVDDGFVVAALELTGYWLDEDLRASVPELKFARLKERGLLGE
jgi:hypothetical protein